MGVVNSGLETCRNACGVFVFCGASVRAITKTMEHAPDIVDDAGKQKVSVPPIIHPPWHDVT